MGDMIAQQVEQSSSKPRVSALILRPHEATCRGFVGQETLCK